MFGKTLTRLAVVTIAAASLLMFGHAQDPVEITIWHNRSQYVPVDRYETLMAEYPHIRIHYDVVPWEEQLSSYLRTFVTGSAPDIFHLEHGVVPMLATQGMLRDISAVRDMWLADDPDDFADFVGATWEALMWDGAMHGMALFPFTRQYNYRIDLFEEHGLEPPTYWSEVIELARVLHSDDVLGYAIEGSRLAAPEKTLNMYQAMGGTFPNGVIQLDSDAGIALLGFIQTLSREGLIHPDTLAWDHSDMRTSFIQGDSAQNYMGSHMYPLTQQNYAYGEEWAMIPVLLREGAEDDAVYGANIFGYIVSSQSEAPIEDIYAVLRYLASPEVLEPIAWEYAPVTRDSIYMLPHFQESLPWWQDMLVARADMVAFPTNPRMPEVYEIIHDARQEAISNPNVDVVEMAQRHQARINALFD